ncbi:MAG: M14 family metallopeptidase [Lachnospiraceae bacterium]|nr:M14 family metallopeptidase [Lachnospiraceae bacterium]MDO5551756.1 M14 family metallopeptidase [Lachnospiraceae bacterium]
MIKKVASVGLPVDERLNILKNRIQPEVLTGTEKRICVVTGTHGDELEGQYVCCLLNRMIKEHKECLKGIVDIYPALNPLGVDSITRGMPMFDLDMNRIFPGTEDGSPAEYVAYKIIQDIEGADLCIDIHASNIFLREIPQVRMSEQTAEALLPYARNLNIDFVWIHGAATVLESTLAHSLNTRGVPTLVVEMGVGMRITESYCSQLADGIFCVMKQLGIWDGPAAAVKEPIVSRDKEVGFLNAEAPGLFIPCVEHWINVEKDEVIGHIYNPLDGTVLSEVKAPIHGMLFTLREYPMVSVGSLLARVLGGDFR